MEGSLQGASLYLLFGFAILIMVALALLVILYSNRAQKRFLEQEMNTQTLKIQYQQSLLEHNLLVQEAERQRIASQLHDDIGAKLGVLHLTFHRLRRLQTDNPVYDTVCKEISDLIGQTLDTTRRISHELLPPTLEDFGLVEALLEFFESVRKTDTVIVEFSCNMDKDDIGDPTKALHLFRIVQEMVNNTLKYAKATQIQVKLWKTEHTRCLSYADNGQGFHYDPAQGKGLGLRNIGNRVHMLGGHWKIQTALNAGFQASVEF